MWILYFVNISAWILGCSGYGSYYNPAPVYSAGPAYSNTFYGNNVAHGNMVPSAVQDVAMQLQYQKQHSTFGSTNLNTGGHTANHIVPNTNQYSTNYASNVQNQYLQQYQQNPQHQNPYTQQQYPASQSSQYAAPQQGPQWGVVPSVQTQYPSVQPQVSTQYQNLQSQVSTQYSNVQPQVQTQYGNVQPQVQTQYGNVQPQVQTQYGNVQPQVQTQYGNVQPQVQTQYANVQPQAPVQYQFVQPTLQPMIQAQQSQVLQTVVQPAVGGTQAATVLQVDTSSLNQNNLVHTQYDPQTNQFLSAIQPLMQPEPSNHPLNPKLYFVMPDDMIPQYPTAVVIARGEPQPGFSIVKWSPENQVTQKAQSIGPQHRDAKMYDYSYDYNDQYQNKYDAGSDYDYRSPAPRHRNDAYSYDEYQYDDYDYSTNSYQHHNAPVRRHSHQGQGHGKTRGERGRFASFNKPRGRAYGQKMQYRRSRNNIPMYMRFAKAFGTRNAKSTAARGPRPSFRSRSRSRPTLRSKFRSSPRSIPKPSTRTRSQGHARNVKQEKYANEMSYDRRFGDDAARKNVEVIYEYEYVDASDIDDDSVMQMVAEDEK